MTRRWSLLAAALILGTLTAPPARAADDADAAPSQWTPPAPPPAPGTHARSSESEYASSDRRKLDEERRRGVLDQLCRNFRLETKFDLAQLQARGLTSDTTLSVTRRTEPDIDGSLALVDQEELASDAGLSKAQPLGSEGSISVSASARMTGDSIVVRRLGTFSSCGELQRVVKVTDVKLAAPFTAKRIAAMEKGELWRLPMTITLTAAAAASAAQPAQSASITLGYSDSKGAAASMTLWRLSEHRARFKFRVDYVTVESKSVSLSKTFSPIGYAQDGGNVLSRFVDHEISRQLQRYTNLYLTLAEADSKGHRLLLEFVADPTDPEQAKALSSALNGNFRSLLAMARTLATSPASQEQAQAAYDALENADKLALGSPAYAARSDYESKGRSFTVHLPFIVHWGDSDTVTRDVTTRLSGEPVEYSFYSAGQAPDREYFDVVFMGPLVKDIEQRHVDVISAGPVNGPHGQPIAVYLDNRAYLRMPASAVRDAVEDANAILRLAGTARGKPLDRTMELPASSFLPKPPGEGSSDKPEPNDQKGWLSFTLVMNQKGVADALSATTDEVLRAFAASARPDDRGWAEWLAKNGRLEGDRLVYDRQRAKEELNISGQDSTGESWLSHLAVQAATLALDLREASAGATPQQRSEALARAFSEQKSPSGRRRSDVVPPEQLMRVLVQFIDPMDLSGYFVAATDAKGSKVAIKANYELKKDRAEVPMLAEAGALRGRFADGGLLTDGGPKD